MVRGCLASVSGQLGSFSTVCQRVPGGSVLRQLVEEHDLEFGCLFQPIVVRDEPARPCPERVGRAQAISASKAGS